MAPMGGPMAPMGQMAGMAPMGIQSMRHSAVDVGEVQNAVVKFEPPGTGVFEVWNPWIDWIVPFNVPFNVFFDVWSLTQLALQPEWLLPHPYHNRKSRVQRGQMQMGAPMQVDWDSCLWWVGTAYKSHRKMQSHNISLELVCCYFACCSHFYVVLILLRTAGESVPANANAAHAPAADAATDAAAANAATAAAAADATAFAATAANATDSVAAAAVAATAIGANANATNGAGAKGFPALPCSFRSRLRTTVLCRTGKPCLDLCLLSSWKKFVHILNKMYQETGRNILSFSAESFSTHHQQRVSSELSLMQLQGGGKWIDLNSANDPMNAGQHNADAHAADAGRPCLNMFGEWNFGVDDIS